jgi:predicted O-methyltransferase YrrM
VKVPETPIGFLRRVRGSLEWRVNRALAPAKSAFNAVEGARDAVRLNHRHPLLVPQPAPREKLHALYRIYVAEVSSPDWAVSWETASYLTHLCNTLRPRRAADLGSGFSSCVLREYAASAPHDVAIVSVDDSEQWLRRTREFLAAHDHNSGEFREWRDFVADPGPPFDLVFHDLAHVPLRLSAMHFATSVLTPSGVIVFDDAHRRDDRRVARQVSRSAGLATYSLYRWTKDAIGRFAMLGAR